MCGAVQQLREGEKVPASRPLESRGGLEACRLGSLPPLSALTLAARTRALQHPPALPALRTEVVKLMERRGVRCSERLDPQSGMDVEALAALLERGERPALIYALSDGHNPLNVSMNLATRQRLVLGFLEAGYLEGHLHRPCSDARWRRSRWPSSRARPLPWRGALGLPLPAAQLLPLRPRATTGGRGSAGPRAAADVTPGGPSLQGVPSAQAPGGPRLLPELTALK